MKEMKLWVIKIGTSLLRGTEKRATANVIDDFCKCFAELIKEGDQLVLVSSGAVGLGCHRLGIQTRPKDLVCVQAAAAVGQGYLMSLYESSMSKYDINVAQVLLTRTDLESRRSYLNASRTIKQLLNWGILPIINENDVISQEELCYGDNDRLSALVANALNAKELILLTDIDRVYSADPRNNSQALPIFEVHNPTELNDIRSTVSSVGEWGTGGIRTKLDAAKIATESGIKVQLADGRDPTILHQLLQGGQGGTIFHPHPEPLPNKKSWLAHALQPVGNIFIDEGACKAIKHQGASLLLVGVKKAEGDFTSNQPVRLLNQQGQELARGISSLSKNEIYNKLRSKSKMDPSPLVIHRDVLVLTEGNPK